MVGGYEIAQLNAQTVGITRRAANSAAEDSARVRDAPEEAVGVITHHAGLNAAMTLLVSPPVLVHVGLIAAAVV